MKWLKRLIVLFVVVDFLTPAHFGMFQADSLAAQTNVPPIPLLTGPQDVSQLNLTLNTIIGEINAILSPLIPTVSGGVNTVSLTPAVTGGSATIGLAAGSDANSGIRIAPNGSGNLTLLGINNTGLVQFGDQASFILAPGLDPYPGPVPFAAAMLGIHSTQQGVLVFKDWLGVARGIPAY